VVCALLLISGSATSAAPELARQQANAPAEEASKIPNDQLDSLVAPIALYPDPLLAQTLAASTYPLELIQLQQWLAKNSGLKDKALGGNLTLEWNTRRDEKTGWQIKNAALNVQNFFLGGLLVLSLMAAASIPSLSQDRPKNEIIQAVAMGTGTQVGQRFHVRLIINEYSTEEDRQILINAFEKGKNQGLINALEKMRAVGRIAIEGTLGYDVSYIRSIPTPTGRKIRFVTNRLLRFGETYYSTRSADYNLSAGELDLNEQDHSKSTGVLYPLAKLRLDKDMQLSLDLNMNPWKLVSILWDR
jgi:hypothetical protein